MNMLTIDQRTHKDYAMDNNSKKDKNGTGTSFNKNTESSFNKNTGTSFNNTLKSGIGSNKNLTNLGSSGANVFD